MLLFFDLLVLLLFFAGFAARYVHPRAAWWLQVVAIGLPLWGLGVVLVTIAFALLASWAGVAAHAPVLVLAAWRFWPGSSVSSPLPADDERLTVATANFKNKYPGDGTTAGSLEGAGAPHLLALQEVVVVVRSDVMGASRHVMPLLARYRICNGAQQAADAETWIQNPILSVLRCVDQRRVQIVPGRNEAEGTSLTRGEYVWRDRRFAVFNVHLRSFSRPSSPEGGPRWFHPRYWLLLLHLLRTDFLARAEEAEHLRKYLEAERLPFILCGDFNATPHSWVYAHLRRGLSDAGSRWGWMASYHARLPLVRIDYVMTSPHWRLGRSRTGRAPLSDHLPLLVDLYLR